MSNAEVNRDPDNRPGLMQELARALRRYQTTLDGFDEAVSKRLGVNRTDLRCYDLLSQHKEMTAGALAKASGLTSGAVTFVIDRLAKAGFVRRGRDADDRRRVVVELDPEAERRAWLLHEPLVLEMREAARRFSEGDLMAIRDFLTASGTLYEKHAELLRQGYAAARRNRHQH